MKSVIRYMLCFLLLAALAGCSQQEVVVEGDALQFLESGEVSYTLCSKFDKSYYNLEELLEMAELEIDNNSIIISSLEESGGEAMLTYLFDSNDVYNSFVNTESFYGTIDAYKAKGYATAIDLIEVKSGEEHLLSEESLSGYTVICWSEDIQLVTGDKILYTSLNLTVQGNTNAVPVEGQSGPYYVLYK
ncbi:MAG: hypothetical protein R3Y47_09250 [Lachnospiraceae bacterium]